MSFDKKYLQSTDRTLSALGANKIKSSKLPANSICFVCIGSTIGKMCMTNCVSYTNQQINSIIPNEKCDNDYLFYLLRYANEYFRSIGAGTGSGKGIVNKTIFSKTKMQISENKEHQQRIASILSAYDDLIENNNKRIKILEQMAENLYKEWFVRFRFPNYQNTEFENGIPNGWNVVKIKKCVKRLAFNRLYKENELEKEGNVIVIDQSANEYLGFHNNEPSHYANYENPIILFGDHTCKCKLMCKDFSLGENVVPFCSSDTNFTDIYFCIMLYIKLLQQKSIKGIGGVLSL